LIIDQESQSENQGLRSKKCEDRCEITIIKLYRSCFKIQRKRKLISDFLSTVPLQPLATRISWIILDDLRELISIIRSADSGLAKRENNDRLDVDPKSARARIIIFLSSLPFSPQKVKNWQNRDESCPRIT